MSNSVLKPEVLFTRQLWEYYRKYPTLGQAVKQALIVTSQRNQLRDFRRLKQLATISEALLENARHAGLGGCDIQLEYSKTAGFSPGGTLCDDWVGLRIGTALQISIMSRVILSPSPIYDGQIIRKVNRGKPVAQVGDRHIVATINHVDDVHHNTVELFLLRRILTQFEELACDHNGGYANGVYEGNLVLSFQQARSPFSADHHELVINPSAYPVTINE